MLSQSAWPAEERNSDQQANGMPSYCFILPHIASYCLVWFFCQPKCSHSCCRCFSYRPSHHVELCHLYFKSLSLSVTLSPTFFTPSLPLHLLSLGHQSFEAITRRHVSLQLIGQFNVDLVRLRQDVSAYRAHVTRRSAECDKVRQKQRELQEKREELQVRGVMIVSENEWDKRRGEKCTRFAFEKTKENMTWKLQRAGD